MTTARISPWIFVACLNPDNQLSCPSSTIQIIRVGPAKNARDQSEIERTSRYNRACISGKAKFQSPPGRPSLAIRRAASLALFYKLGDRPIFLAELSDAELVVVNAVDRTQDQPTA